MIACTMFAQAVPRKSEEDVEIVRRPPQIPQEGRKET